MAKEFGDGSVIYTSEQEGMYSIIHEYKNAIHCVINSNDKQIIISILKAILNHSTLIPTYVSSITTIYGDVYHDIQIRSEVYDDIYAIYYVHKNTKLYIFDKEIYYY